MLCPAAVLALLAISDHTLQKVMDVKKLRGSKRLLEYGLAEQAPPKARQEKSFLAEKLISLWAHGLLSAAGVQEIAHCALQDGASKEFLQVLAKTGNWGARPNNCQRDLYVHVLKDLKLPEPFRFTTQVKEAVSQEVGEQSMDILLPHEMFSGLQGYKIFDQMFDAANLEKFWTEALARGDDRLKDHPSCLAKDWKQSTFPLFLHGDGVEYQTRDSLMVFSWGNALQKAWGPSALHKGSTSMSKHILCAAFPKSVTTESTWDAPWAYLKWSFEHLAKGFHPKTDPWGKPFPKSSRFWKLRGSPLTPQGYRGVLWFIEGDHDFHSNVLFLPHWASKTPCFACNATLSAGPKSCERLEWEAFHFWGTEEVAGCVGGTLCMCFTPKASMDTSWAACCIIYASMTHQGPSRKSSLVIGSA